MSTVLTPQEFDALSTAYTQLEQQQTWAVERQMFTLADAYQVALGHLAARMVEYAIVEDAHHAN